MINRPWRHPISNPKGHHDAKDLLADNYEYRERYRGHRLYKKRGAERVAATYSTGHRVWKMFRSVDDAKEWIDYAHAMLKRKCERYGYAPNDEDT